MRDADFLTAHFALAVPPFSALPDPAFLYWTEGLRRSWSLLEYSLMSGAPVTLLTGAAGTGKTLLLRHALEVLEGGLTAGLVNQTQGGWQAVLPWVLQALGLEVEPPASAVRQFDRLQSFLIEEYAAGRRVVLIFDEAQNLDAAALEELRMLTNINAGADCLLQIVLCGQDGLRERLSRPDTALLAQRAALACRLVPLSEAETQDYVAHRLAVAGADPALFSEGAVAALHRAGAGVPRALNQLAEFALLAAFSGGADIVTPAHVDEVLGDATIFGPHIRPGPAPGPSDMRSAS
jgi:type II secretory pathway predicted ATPase ExeA